MTSQEPSENSEEFKRSGRDVRVQSQEGFLCKIKMKAVIDMPPSEVYTILTHEDNTSLFRAIDSVHSRKVLSDSEELKSIYIEQTATVGILMFKRQFTTALEVSEHPKKLAAEFTLAKPGIMAAFQGKWWLSEVSADDFERMVQTRVPCESWEGPVLENSKKGEHGNHPRTLMELEQDVAPAIAQKVPPMFHGILRRMSAAAASDIIKDLNVVAALRRSGVSLDAILSEKVHGRGGLKHRVLQGNPQKRSSANSSVPSFQLPVGEDTLLDSDDDQGDCDDAELDVHVSNHQVTGTATQ